MLAILRFAMYVISGLMLAAYVQGCQGPARRRFLPNRGRPQFGLWLLLVPVSLVVVAQLALLVYTGFLSTQDWTLTQSQVSKGWIGDQNFTEVLDDPVFWRSVVNSALITGISVPIQLFLGIHSQPAYDRDR